MAIVSSGMLMDALRQHSLLTEEQLAQLAHEAPGRCGDARLLAKSLIQKSWLTVYQINELLCGKPRELVVGPYHVIDKLGQGGLSQVYKARHKEHGYHVAIKMIRPEIFAGEEGKRHFLQEVEAMAKLDHPNIVQFCDADRWENTYYFAMEYIEGTDLGKLVRLSGALPVAEACDFIRQAALGLQHAYEHNLVHRDIKPVNLFLTNDARTTKPGLCLAPPLKPAAPPKPIIKILDWGLAIFSTPKGAAPQASAEGEIKGIIGTADYLAPEQARHANMVDIRGDIYSLGCSFYYLLTGQPPFPDGTLMQKVLQHQQGEPKPMEDFRADVPAEVIAVLRRMLAKQPQDRFQTPASVALALAPCTRRALRAPQPVPALTLPRMAPSPAPDTDTPLPAALGGNPGEPFERLPRAGAARGGDPRTDTADPRHEVGQEP